VETAGTTQAAKTLLSTTKTTDVEIMKSVLRSHQFNLVFLMRLVLETEASLGQNKSKKTTEQVRTSARKI